MVPEHSSGLDRRANFRRRFNVEGVRYRDDEGLSLGEEDGLTARERCPRTRAGQTSAAVAAAATAEAAFSRQRNGARSIFTSGNMIHAAAAASLGELP